MCTVTSFCSDMKAFKCKLSLVQFAVDKHTHKRMVGTREVLREEKETQPNGKVFTKLDMGEYHWKTYLAIDKMATNFGRGLRELGLNRM